MTSYDLKPALVSVPPLPVVDRQSLFGCFHPAIHEQYIHKPKLSCKYKALYLRDRYIIGSIDIDTIYIIRPYIYIYMVGLAKEQRNYRFTNATSVQPWTYCMASLKSDKFREQWRSWEIFSGSEFRGSGNFRPQWGWGAKPRWGSGSEEAAEASVDLLTPGKANYCILHDAVGSSSS